jgi:hypothetical protein
MPEICLSTEGLLKRVQEDRLREELLHKPYLIAFRAAEEEIEFCGVDNAQEVVSGYDEFGRFAERLARSGREEVRFQRYLIRQGFYPKIPKDDPLGVGWQKTKSRSSALRRRMTRFLGWILYSREPLSKSRFIKGTALAVPQAACLQCGFSR